MYRIGRIIFLLTIASQTGALLTSPPRIVKQPPIELLFQVAQTGETHKPFIIECEAEGEPAPKYRWIKNGKPFEYSSYDKRISQQPGRGTLFVSEPRDEDLGQYQCFADNEWGTATSNSVFLRKAELNSFGEPDSDQQTVIAQEGQPFHLGCKPPTGYPNPNVYWMLQGDQGQLKTINNSRMTLDPEGTLWFSNVTRDDASEDYAYICAAKSVFKNEYKVGNKVYLQVTHTGISPTLNKQPPTHQYTTKRNERAWRGKKVELYCIYGGTPLPQVVWKKDGMPILSSHRVTQDNYGKTLVIKRPRYEDEGTYTCEVSNGVGTAQTHSISLEIQAAPLFTEEPDFQNLAEGETATIRCKADGTPPPQIHWIHNGKPIEYAPPNSRRTVNPDSIVIVDLVKNDTGNYGCNATNSNGYVYKDIYINVQSIKPEIKEGPGKVVKADGSEAILKCRVFGAPKPIVTWVRDGEAVTGKAITTPEGDLIIRNVTYNDVGEYTCWAKNKLGEATATGSLVVKKRTRITDRPQDFELAAGKTATFRCNAEKDDSLKLEVTWLYKGEPIDHDSQPRFKKMSDHSLVIFDTTELDSGEYTCIAKSAIDEDRAQATLIVEDKPNAPALDGIECGARMATLRWHSMGDRRAPILRYSIEYNTTFTPDTWQVSRDDVPGKDTSWSIELSPWANYTFRVIAWNKIGPSPPSPHSDVCTTQPDLPYKHPDNVRGHGSTPNNMVISWTEMPQIEHNGPGFRYIVNWKRNISGVEWENVQVDDWHQNQYIVPNLPTFQPYKIKVLAANNKGTANVAAVEVIGWSGEDVPLEAPSNFTLMTITSGTSAYFSFTPVSPESVRGHFQGYKIQSWTDDGEEPREKIYTNESSNVLYDKLKPFTRNYARIFAFNSLYNGPPSNKLTFVMPEGIPGTVRTFDAKPMGSSAMFLTWDKPMNENGVLIGYKVRYYKLNDNSRSANWMEKKLIPPQFDSAKLAGLEPNSEYRIEIMAVNKAGHSAPVWVERMTGVSENKIPDVPKFDYKVLPGKEEGSATVTAHMLVRWLIPPTGHPGTHFVAWYKLKGHPMWTRTQDIVEEDYVTIRGLEPGQEYEVKITAHDGNYHSASEVKIVDTTLDGPVVQREDKMATAGWFIGVMLALAFLLLVLVLVCVVRRNRGGKYDVHDRELAHGRRDYPEGGFHEYTHPLDNKSRHSMSSTKPGAESDTDSMAEYGDGETAGRFTEDGSFIGQYVPGARVLPPPTATTPAIAMSPPSPPAPPRNSANQPPTYV